MNPLLSTAIYIYPFLCVFLPCIIYQFILYKRNQINGKINAGNLMWRYVFIFYLYLVMRAVGIGTIWDIGSYDSIITTDQIYLIPFQLEGTMTYILNIILFMPLGFLLPLLWKKCRKMQITILGGFIFSFLIEVGQLFNLRLTDIDDLITNVFGTIIGYLIWLILNKMIKGKAEFKNIKALEDSPLIYILLAVLGTFFLYSWRWFFYFQTIN